MNFEENKNVKSYFTCSLSSLLGFWVVLGAFRLLLLFFSDFLPLVKSGRKKMEKIPERLQNHPATENRRQRTTKVPFNSFIFFNIRF